MRTLVFGTLCLVLSLPTMAQAPPGGPYPASAVSQQTEPGRYWVFFDFNKSSLRPDARKVVAAAAEAFEQAGAVQISLVGSADRTGSQAYNEKLSRRRADTVRRELERLGVPASAIMVAAEGENAPIVPTGEGVREARNRYVAIDFAEHPAELPPPPAVAAAPEAPSTPEPAPSLLQQTLSAPLEITVTPYLWALSLDGHATIKGIKSDVDVSFDDILQHLNGAVMLEAEIRKGRFGLVSNTLFAKLYDNENTAHDRIKIDTDAKMFMQGLAGTYRVGTWTLAEPKESGPLAVAVDPYVGARFTYLEGDLTGKLDLPRLGIKRKRSVSANKSWTDALVGMRTIWTLGDRWNVTLAGDVGGFDVGSDFSWQAVGVVGYRFGLFSQNDARVLVGYRALYQDFEDGNGRVHLLDRSRSDKFEWNITMHGPVIAFSLQF